MPDQRIPPLDPATLILKIASAGPSPCFFFSLFPLLFASECAFLRTNLRINLEPLCTYSDELLLFVYSIAQIEPQRPDGQFGVLPFRTAVASRQCQREVQQL